MAPRTGTYGTSWMGREVPLASATRLRRGIKVASPISTGAAIQPAASGVAVRSVWPSISSRT